ncbi:hypothetical protein PENSPDRAFT_744766 [Peniophora sp. CONT]|nr:hypothetical protein PENSPDRAFT_744766 [Peniophora sp. CONT]
MFIPFLTKRAPLERRRGGGGGGKSAGGGGGGGSFGGSKSGGFSGTTGLGSSSSTKSVSTPNLAGGRGNSATAYGAGGIAVGTIAAGSLFAGRSTGGGTRSQVYGTNVYGSGYPGVAAGQRGVSGLGFPFLYWPVVFGGAGIGTAAYLHESHEYGDPSNSSRPGGPMMQAAFISNFKGNTFHVLADKATVVSLISSVTDNCWYDLSSNSSTSPSSYSGNNTGDPQPESSIQYYRASSVALTLDGYNNTAALSNDSNAPATPLPTTGLDTVLLSCLNATIGAAVPLVALQLVAREQTETTRE